MAEPQRGDLQPQPLPLRVPVVSSTVNARRNGHGPAWSLRACQLGEPTSQPPAHSAAEATGSRTERRRNSLRGRKADSVQRLRPPGSLVAKRKDQLLTGGLGAAVGCGKEPEPAAGWAECQRAIFVLVWRRATRLHPKAECGSHRGGGHSFSGASASPSWGEKDVATSDSTLSSFCLWATVSRACLP